MSLDCTDLTKLTVQAPVAPSCCSRGPAAAPEPGSSVVFDAARAGGPGPGGVATGEEIAVPAQDGVRADQQADSLQRGAGQRLEQSGQQRPIGRLEPDPLVAELALQLAELVAQHEDLGVLVMVAAG